MTDLRDRKLLVLGAGEAQLQIIRASKELGICTIVCDMRPEMEGARIADRYYRVNYMDREAILEVARREEVDGVISNSEPAMINVAWLSEQMGLPGNSERSVQILLSKDAFRSLQEEAGVFAPSHRVVSDEQELFEAVHEIGLPLVIKPVLSSGTRGTTVIETEDRDRILWAYRECTEFSRDGRASVEQYVQMDSLVAYDAELFVCGEEILWDGLYASYRYADAPMLPVMESLPLDISPERQEAIKTSIGTMIRAAGIRLGEYNAETYFTREGEVFVIEINPRQGGNHIPDLVCEHAGIDLTKLLCATAVGDLQYFREASAQRGKRAFVTMYVVFSLTEGTYRGLSIDEEIRPYVRWVQELAAVGEHIHKKENAGDSLAFVRMSFDSAEQQKAFMSRIDTLIRPVVG